MYGWNTCFTVRSTPPCQGDDASLTAISSLGRASPSCTREDASHQSLQSTCCHENSQKPLSSRAWSSRPAALRDLDRASDPARLYRTKHAPSTNTQASRCRHHLPRVASRFGADFASCGSVASTLSGCLGCPDRLTRALSTLVRAETAKPLTSLYLRSDPGCPEPTTRA
jgi:hypothetical protein